MNSTAVEGSIRAIISSLVAIKPDWVDIPSWICDSNINPVIVDGNVISRTLQHSTWCILIRQPYLHSSGAQPVRVHIIHEHGHITSTLMLPIYMCEPYGADYNKDEMTPYPIYSSDVRRVRVRYSDGTMIFT